jgi:hypothetical protein
VDALVPSLLGETVELARDCMDAPSDARGVVRAVYLAGIPDREDVGGPRELVCCLVQMDSGDRTSVEACFLRVRPPKKR